MEGEGAEAELCCSHRGISWTVTLLRAPCLPLSHSTLKFSISALWDEFVSVRLSLQQPHEFTRLLLPLGSQLTPNPLCAVFLSLLCPSLREGMLSGMRRWCCGALGATTTGTCGCSEIVFHQELSLPAPSGSPFLFS